MKHKLYLLFLLIVGSATLFAQTQTTDTTLKKINLKEVVVTSNRLPILLKNNPGAISLITPEQLSIMPKAIGVEEALRLTPGVRIDNQHDGERVHLSIRGQGILTERGLRGIGVMVDGIPLNDPSGFAPDLYDVDWATVQRIEVLRGPAASMYGGGAAGGVLNITTKDGGNKPLGGEISQTIGSNGFRKTLAQVDGSKSDLNYRVSFSRTDGDGYRDHQAFQANKFYEKITFKPTDKLSITQILSHTDYFQQNPEGLNIDQFDNLRQANPDACPFNEYQNTNRNTAGFHGVYKISAMHEIEATAYMRSWKYKETSNKAAEYRNITNPGASVQYNLHFNTGTIKHTLSAGADARWQNIDMYKLESAANPFREESTDKTNLETDSLLANQIISQRSMGAFALYNLTAGRFNLMGSVRYDDMYNELTDKLNFPFADPTTKSFNKASGRIGISYSFADAITAFANWSQGFIPPSTEELASNPVSYAGFNTYLVPATSNCYEAGIRGFLGQKFYYEVTGFYMKTENDFFRFKQHDRGNQEVFYGNAGNSRRIGVETFASYKVLPNLSVQAAYTFADYKYESATIESVYTDTAYVQTAPPAKDQWLPNSPQHQLYGEVVYSPERHFRLSCGVEYQSKWAIYTDSISYNGSSTNPLISNWQDGFTLVNASAAYNWKIWGIGGELSFSVRNLTDESYMAFTEPDPDGNSYQPGPGREFFVKLRLRF